MTKEEILLELKLRFNYSEMELGLVKGMSMEHMISTIVLERRGEEEQDWEKEYV